MRRGYGVRWICRYQLKTDPVFTRGYFMRDNYTIFQGAPELDTLAVLARGNQLRLVLDYSFGPIPIGRPGPAVGFQVLKSNSFFWQSRPANRQVIVRPGEHQLFGFLLRLLWNEHEEERAEQQTSKNFHEHSYYL